MTPEERFQQQVELLLKQQAQFYSDLQKVDERIDRSSQQIERNSGQIEQVTDLLLRLGRVVEEQAGRTDELRKAQERADDRLNRLAESQQRTDDRLKILIGIVERYFSDGRP